MNTNNNQKVIKEALNQLAEILPEGIKNANQTVRDMALDYISSRFDLMGIDLTLNELVGLSKSNQEGIKCA